MELNKKQEYWSIAGLLFLILPFFVLIFYVHPQCDDFFFARKLQQMGPLSFVKDMYLNWSGRYFSMFLGALDPWCYESLGLFRLSLFGYQLIFIAVFITFFKALFNKAIRIRSVVLFSLLFYVVFIQTVPDLFEILYWYPSVSAYQIGSSFYLLLIALFTFNFKERLSNGIYLTSSVLLVIMNIGSNELFIIPLGFTVLVFTYIRWINNKSIKHQIIIMLTLLLFSLIMVLAPGNYSRMDCYSESISIGSALWLSAKSFLYITAHYFQSPTFIIASMVFAAFIRQQLISKKIKSFKLSKVQFIAAITISILFLLVILFPATYSLKCIPSYRVLNQLAFFFFLVWAFNIFLFIIYLTPNNVNIHANITNKILISLLFISLFNGAFITDIHKFKENKREGVFLKGNFLRAYYTLLFEAKTYDKEITARYDSFAKANAENKHTVLIKPLTYQPDILVEMGLKNIDTTKSLPEFLFFGEKNYYNIDTLYCE